MLGRAIFVTVALLALCLASLAPTTADQRYSQTQFTTAGEAIPGVFPAGAESSEVYLEGDGNEASDPAASTSRKAISPNVSIAAIGCTPVSGRDNPHYSGGDVSGHGWWGKGTCTKPTARVKNCLYEWYTDNSWRLKKCSVTKTLQPGSGGSGRRTNARIKCDNRAQTSWRNHVDVDVIGQIDTGEKPYRQSLIGCRVY